MGFANFGNLDSSEFETIFELILSMFFMMFGVFAIGAMCVNMSGNVELTKRADKIEDTKHWTTVEDDPFWLNGYEAYMLSWHMDEVSYEDLHYVANSVENYVHNEENPIAVKINAERVKLSVYDDSGKILPQFISTRNKRITDNSNSVRSVLTSVATSNNVSIEDLFIGENTDIKFHLDLTGKFAEETPEGKIYEWVVAPYR